MRIHDGPWWLLRTHCDPLWPKVKQIVQLIQLVSNFPTMIRVHRNSKWSEIESKRVTMGHNGSHWVAMGHSGRIWRRSESRLSSALSVRRFRLRRSLQTICEDNSLRWLFREMKGNFGFFKWRRKKERWRDFSSREKKKSWKLNEIGLSEIEFVLQIPFLMI